MEHAETSRRTRHPFSGLVVLLAVLAVATACGSGSGSAGSAPAASGAPKASSGSATGSGSTVEIDKFMFMPATLTVPVGATVTWKFDDSTQHTVTANDNSFTSPPMAGGQTFTHRPMATVGAGPPLGGVARRRPAMSRPTRRELEQGRC